MVKALRAGQDAPPTVFEASRACCTNSLHERVFFTGIIGVELTQLNDEVL